MWQAIIGTALRAWFIVERNGVPRTGLAAGAFTVTVVEPTDAASSTPAVTESAQAGGLYYFDVPGAFFTTHGVGIYGVQVVVAAGGPVIRATMGEFLKVTQQDLDTISAAVWEEVALTHNTLGSAGQILNVLRKIPLNRLGEVSGNPGTFILYDDDSITPLFTMSLRDEDGNATIKQVGVPAQRSKAAWP